MEKPIIFSTEIEEWKPVIGYEGRYEVSNCGQVKSLDSIHRTHRGKMLFQYTQNKGYKYVDLRNEIGRKTFSVHRLVLEAFIELMPKGKQAAHGDGNPGNNFAGNLRWATAKENSGDRKRHGRTAEGEKSGTSKLDIKCVKIIKKLKDKGFFSGEIAHLACVCTPTIERIWNGETWRCV